MHAMTGTPKHFLAHHVPLTMTGLVMVILYLLRQDLQVTQSALVQIKSTCIRVVDAPTISKSAAATKNDSEADRSLSRARSMVHNLNEVHHYLPPSSPPASKQQGSPPVFHLVISKASDDHKDPLSMLNIRCMESIFYFHPKATLKIHTNRRSGLRVGLKHYRLDALRQRGYDLQLIKYNQPQDVLQQAVDAAPHSEINPHVAAKFRAKLDSKQLQHEKYWYANEANLMRLCILYLEGGIYLDTDVVLINNRLGSDARIDQAMGRHRDGTKFHNAVMKFTKPGNRFLAAVINNMMEQYDGTKWGNNGPKAFGRTAKKFPKWVCQEDRFDYSHNNPLQLSPSRRQEHEDCYLTPLPNDSVAPFSYKEWDDVCFGDSSPSYSEIKHRLDHSYLVHFNNKKTGKQLDLKQYKKGSLCDHVLSSYCILCED